MEKFEKFASYNQITKEFDVLVMNKSQINQLDNSKHFLVLNPKKTKTVLTKTNSKPKQPSLRQLILDLTTRLDQIDKRVNNLEQKVDARFNALEKRIDNLVAKNNLVE